MPLCLPPSGISFSVIIPSEKKSEKGSESVNFFYKNK